MQDELSILKNERAAIEDFFLQHAHNDGYEVNPLVRSDIEIILTRKIYEEKFDNRQLSIELSEGFEPSSSGIKVGNHFDAFIKNTGINYDIELLYVGVSGTQNYLNLLYDLYVRWIHKREVKAGMEAYLDQVIPLSHSFRSN